MNATRRRMSWMHHASVRGLLLTLTLLFAPWSGVPAAEDTEQEIGVPFIDEGTLTKEESDRCFNGVLLPHKDGFYTVRDGLLSEYQIKPFKRVRSIEIDPSTPEAGRLKYCKIWTTDDQSKVIIYNREKLFLLDAYNGKVLNSRDAPEDVEIRTAKIDDDEIFVLFELKHHEKGGEAYILATWDMNTLTPKITVPLGERASLYSGGERRNLYMMVIHKKIYLRNLWTLVVLNAKTLAPELRVSTMGGIFLLPDFTRLFIFEPREIIDYLTHKNQFSTAYKGTAVIFNQSTRETTASPAKGNARTIVQSSIIDIDGRGYQSINDNHSLHMYATSRLEIAPLSIGSGPLYMPIDPRYDFHQYENGEGVMMIGIPGDKNRYFSITPNARKHLMMRKNNGEVTAINDPTFDKLKISN